MNMNYAGVQNAEAQDRYDEVRTGLPRFGSALALLLFAPIDRTESVHVVNAGDLAIDTWLRHAGSQKAVAVARLEAMQVGATDQFTGRLQHKAIVPRTAAGLLGITITDASQTLVDDGEGVMLLQGTTTVVGSIDYATGLIDVTFPAAAVLPVQAAYTHADYTDFLSPQQAIPVTPTTGFPFAFATPFGRVAAGTVAFTVGALTFVDDGRGNIIETTAAGEGNRGTIDYATGLITLTSSSAALGANITSGTYNFNPFAQRVGGGGSAKLLSIFGSSIPELTAEPFADGAKGESLLGLVGRTAEAGPVRPGGNLAGFAITKWAHFGEDPYRVDDAFTGFPPGGAVALAGNANA